jgi:predicted transcriptional regulator
VSISLEKAHAVFRRWLGDDYDLAALDAVLAASAVEQLDGDPVWLLVVSGSGNAKTETVQALAGAGATVTSIITSEGALLSGTSRREASKDATGGLLRKLGDRGVLVIKDVTSILSMGREVRAGVLAALREVYDGRWERNVGTDGGRTLTWTGRLVVVGAVTTAYDSAHGVIASMGDRFALVRVDSNLGRTGSGRRALSNVGQEVAMRAELAQAVGAVLDGLEPDRAVITDRVLELLLAAADLATLARTGVERDGRGDVIDAHAPEMPTRFAKMLGQLVRGGLALGMEADSALEMALRVAGDSLPPLRLLALADLQAHAGARVVEVTKRLQRPRTTVDRTLQELHVIGLAVVDDAASGQGWRYRLSERIDETTLIALITRKVSAGARGLKEEAASTSPRVRLVTDVSGHPSRPSVPSGRRRGPRVPTMERERDPHQGSAETVAHAPTWRQLSIVVEGTPGADDDTSGP